VIICPSAEQEEKEMLPSSIEVAGRAIERTMQGAWVPLAYRRQMRAIKVGIQAHCNAR
jgi:hypothetical protein